MEIMYTNALVEFESKAKALANQYVVDLSKLRIGNDQLQLEISRLQQAESEHARTLEQVERNAQDELLQYGDKTRLLTSECSDLRDNLNRSIEENISTQNASVPTSELESVRTEFEEKLKSTKVDAQTLKEQNIIIEAKAKRLRDECEVAQTDACSSREAFLPRRSKRRASCAVRIGESAACRNARE